ncbi:MAG: thioredoxin family protein [Bacteroidales bacterium]|nr:thioredoxin family protein [Bacteroidales bacterium]
MNNPDIKLLCPPKKCGKCRRMIKRVEMVLNEMGIEESVQIVNDLEELQKYPTWVLPTLVIDNKVIARGYIPSSKTIREFLQPD